MHNSQYFIGFIGPDRTVSVCEPMSDEGSSLIAAANVTALLMASCIAKDSEHRRIHRGPEVALATPEISLATTSTTTS